ncbi:MAG TPA: ATP-dependent DNA helicase, partial [Burkholderiaceae bacterium]|nr:ATP-dependent DNA helicase [Burkholderiaceae bacterium]
MTVSASSPANDTPRQHDAQLAQLFAEDGPIARATGHYRFRAAQVEMACEIAHAIETRGTVIAEAGTGTGKTFAYLVPALLWGGKVIVSTGTKTLQDQLFARDLPAVRDALGVPVSVALLKGRANYVCHHHAHRATSQGRFASREDAAHLRHVMGFIERTHTGDKAELSSVPEHSPIWLHVTSTRDNCLGQECGWYRDCFVMKARREAQQADVVVVNHHLFFADVMLRDEGVSELLPAANTVIFDEAHQLPETATLFFGNTVSTAQLLELARDAQVEGLAHAREVVNWPTIAGAVERCARDLRLAFPAQASRIAVKQLPVDTEVPAAIARLEAALTELRAALDANVERSEDMPSLARRAGELAERLAAWGKPDDNEAISWADVYASGAVQLHRSPLSVASIFAKEREAYPRAWIFTSATLAMRDDFSHYADRLGLKDVVARAWPSPFEFATQALLYVPERMPEPQSPAFLEALVERAWPLIEVAGGRTFFLCTTLRAVDRIADLLEERLARADITLLRQGQGGRSELLDRFRRAQRAVLVGSQSFWEGVDVRGQALSLVVIDKLPFAPPDDPVLAARLDRIAREGGNPFMEHQVPAAVISLKQGAGRLIRSETDRGVLMIGDTRLVTRPYGKLIWRSLPPFARTRDDDTAARFLS